jgi:serine/threonine protein phosphatase 1
LNWIAKRVEDFLRKAPESAALIRESAGNVAPPPLLYAVGDIHGMRAKLDRLVDLIESDAEIVARDAVVVFLGDLINRGPASRQVLERLIAGPHRAGDRWITLRGNHDQLFIDAISGKSEAAFEQLLRKGGLETLASYGVRKKDVSLARARRAVPSEHLRFLENLPLSYVAGDYFFVHAGVDPARPLEQQTEKALMTIREPFLRNAHRLPFTVVHGHVANMKGPVVGTNRICVDTGAYATGVLTAVALTHASRGDRPTVRFLATRPG